MSELQGQISGAAASGFLALRQHDPDWPVGQKAVTYGVLAEYTKDRGLRIEGDDNLNAGDLQSWNLWRGGSRKASSWSQAFSALISSAPKPRKGTTTAPRGGIGLLPARDAGTPDDRYESKTLQLAARIPKQPRFPVGWSGHVSSAMEENRQVDLFHPDNLNALIAVNKDGDFNMGTEVYDLDANNQLSQTRHAPIHRLLSVLEVSWCGRQGKTVALNLTDGGNKDKGLGFLHFVDYKANTVAIGHESGGGPFIAPAGCTHTLGVDADGRRVIPLHLNGGQNKGAIFVGDAAEAPLKLRPTTWITPDASEAQDFNDPGFWKEAYCRIDPEDFHTAGCASRPGMWKWQVKVPITIIKGEGDPPPPPDPPPEIYIPSPPLTPLPGGGRPVTGGGTGVDDNGGNTYGPPDNFLPIPTTGTTEGSTGVSGTGLVVGGGGELQPIGEPPDEGPSEPISEPPLDEVIGDPEDGALDLTTPTTTGEEDGAPEPEGPDRPVNAGPPRDGATYGGSAACTFFPNVMFQAHPTSGDEIRIGDSPLSPEAIEDAIRVDPLTGAFSPVAIGDGNKGGYTTTGSGGFNHADESAITLHPTGVDPYDVIAGEYDPCRTGTTAPAVTRLSIPGGLASLDFAHPVQSSTQVTRCGGRIREADDGDGLVLEVLDSSGVAISGSTVAIGDGTFTVGGAAVATGAGGSNAGIGGSGEDGAITLSASTGYGAIVNATTFTLNATYTVYANQNKALVVKSTGAQTINGAISMDGRGYVEPA